MLPVLHTVQEMEPIIPVEQEYHAPELHLIKEEHLEENEEAPLPRLPQKRPIVKLQTERRLVRVPVLEMQRHISSSNLHSSDKDPIEVSVDKIPDPHSVTGFLVTEQACKVQHLGQTCYSCPFCSQVFPLFSDVKPHVMLHSTQEIRNWKNAAHTQKTRTAYSCKFCNEVFTSLHELKKHTNNHLAGVATQTVQLPPIPTNTLISSAVGVLNNENTHNVIEHTRKTNQLNVGEKLYFSCLSCPQLFATFPEAEKHSLIHDASGKNIKLNRFGVVKISSQGHLNEQTLDHSDDRNCATKQSIHINPTVEHSANVNKSVAHTEETIKEFEVKEKPCTTIDELFTKEACQFRYQDRNFYSCISCPKLYATFPEVKKHGLTHFVTGNKVTKPTPNVPISTTKQSTYVNSSNLERSTKVDQNVVRAPETVGKPSVTIADFTEEACLFKNRQKTFYSCLACPTLFSTFPKVKKHALLHFVDIKRYNCTVCYESFDNNETLKVHKLKHIPEKHLNLMICEKGLEHNPTKNTISGKKYECSICKQSFDAYNLFKNHKRKHVTERPFKCVVCEKGFTTSSHLTEHVKTHSTNKKFECDLCDYKSNSRFRINYHKLDRHTSEYTHLCKTCGKGFTSERQLKGHSKIHAERTFKCPDCDKTFYKQNNLQSHKRCHNLNQPRICTCEICGETFTNQANLRSHISRRHTDKHAYKCEICGKIVSTPASLASHRRMHTGEKPFTCIVCDKTFNAKNSLTVHLRVHTGEKPYKCDQCGKAFSQRSSLNIHKRCHTGLKPYACEECPKSFVTKTHLNNHEKKAHPS